MKKLIATLCSVMALSGCSKPDNGMKKEVLEKPQPVPVSVNSNPMPVTTGETRIAISNFPPNQGMSAVAQANWAKARANLLDVDGTASDIINSTTFKSSGSAGGMVTQQFETYGACADYIALELASTVADFEITCSRRRAGSAGLKVIHY